jgi:hypothetical protein
VRVTAESSLGLRTPLCMPGATPSSSAGTIHIRLNHAQASIEGSADPVLLRVCWSVCNDDHASSQHADLDCRGSDRYAVRFRRVERLGTNQVGTSAVFRARICVSWPAWGSDQVAVVRWRRALSILEAAGKRKIYLAASQRRHGFVDPRTAIDVAGGHRLATTRAHLDTTDVSVDALWIRSIIF